MISIIALDPLAYTAIATLNVILQSGETFQAGRDPLLRDKFVCMVPFVLSSTQPQSGVAYTLTLPSAGVWWVRTIKGGVATCDPLPVILDKSVITPITEIGWGLRDILKENVPAINLYMSAVQPGTSVQSVRYGGTWDMSNKTPAITIAPRNYLETYEEAPYGRFVTVSYTISAIIRINDAHMESELLGQVCYALANLLNQQCYETFTLDSGLVINGCKSETHELTSFNVDDTTYANMVSIPWSCQFIRRTQ